MVIMMGIVACRSGGDEKDGGNLVVVTGNWDDDGDGANNGLVHDSCLICYYDIMMLVIKKSVHGDGHSPRRMSTSPQGSSPNSISGT